MKKVFFVLCMIFIKFLSFGNDKIIYPKFSSENDFRYLEEIELLKTALEKTKSEYGSYSLSQSNVNMNQLRYVDEVKKGKDINIIWGGTNVKLEKELLPIRIPISKGILGYRVFLINKDDQPKFRMVNNLEDLKKYVVGQGKDWGDVQVFEANGIKVEGGNDYEGLFNMLSKQRFDYFSRGINEVYTEFENRKDKYPNMIVEDSILLYYPWPYYFFVSPKTPKIAKRIEKGLNLMINDGTFDKIFYKYNSKSIEKANLKNRKIIKINNPNLPKTTPLNDKRLWFVP